jgi:four helix bundle protein
MKDEIMRRTKNITLDAIRLVDEMPNKPSIWQLSRQFMDSAASIGANYRAACRPKSRADMLNKFKIVEEEADETLYWLEIFEESGTINNARLIKLKREVNEILSIIVASLRTLRANHKRSKDK